MEDLVRLEDVVREVTCIEDLVLDIEYHILDIDDGSATFNISLVYNTETQCFE